MPNDKVKLIIADSESDSNMFYVTGFMTPDAFTFIQKMNGEKIVVVNDLEIDRAKMQSRADTVLAYSEYEKIAIKRGYKSPSFIEVIVVVLKEMKIGKLIVPANFDILYADFLRKKGFKLQVKKGTFFDSRETKRKEEVDDIIKTQRGIERAMHKAVDYIRKTKIKNGFLYTRPDTRVTAEFTRKMINIELLKDGLVGKHTIVSCGEQSCIPHNIGDGDLRANESIIFDVFPKDEKTGYYADMSRTIVRGKASVRLKKMFKAVISAQEVVFKLAKNGVDGNHIHSKVVKHLKDLGFKTGKKNGQMQGFFHGTGHGVGLDVHESPRISKVKHTLKSGNVVTVEPGLYYPGIGGVRIEDMILITDDGCINLTEFP
ncbi:MAG: M24 family metallopeptidase, partial [Candidatus Anammoxibacter sp.]